MSQASGRFNGLAVVVTGGTGGLGRGVVAALVEYDGRVLLARSVATHTIDRVGHHLLDQSGTRPELVDLVAGIRIGSNPRPTRTTKGAER